LIGPVVGGIGVGVGVATMTGGLTPPGKLLAMIGPVAGGIEVGVAVMTGGSLPPPELLLEVESGGLGAGVVGVAEIGGSLPPDWGWTWMVPPWPLLELVAFVPPDWELVAFMLPDWDWIGTGIKSPPLPRVGLLPPLPLLVAFVPPDWKSAAFMPPGNPTGVKLAPSPGCLVPLELVARVPPTELVTCLPPP
jgi:hypothetical protein